MLGLEKITSFNPLFPNGTTKAKHLAASTIPLFLLGVFTQIKYLSKLSTGHSTLIWLPVFAPRLVAIGEGL